jgi:lipoate-protein ligase A
VSEPAAWRLVDDLDVPLDAAGQMAADVALLQEVMQGAPPALRLYRWHRPALSLGRFQPDTDVDTRACAAHGVEIVRRPTGGQALLHGADLTYAVAMPRPPGPDGAVGAVYCRLAGGLIAGLAALGVVAEVASHRGKTGAACFASLRGSDLRVGGRKLVGSAQRNRDDGILQHGSVLLDRLGFDETDLLSFPDEAARAAERARLVDSTVTLGELGVHLPSRTVATALTSGFAQALHLDFDLDFRLKAQAHEFVAAEEGRQ